MFFHASPEVSRAKTLKECKMSSRLENVIVMVIAASVAVPPLATITSASAADALPQTV